MKTINPGDKSFRWTVIKRTSKGRTWTKDMWLCQCECGTRRSITAHSIVYRSSKSCGCLKKEIVKARSIKHGMSGTAEYQAWADMKQRCFNSNHPNFKHWGGRGITVCDKWIAFQNFYEDMGKAPQGSTLERIDNNKGYSPDNCKWATWREQASNRRPQNKQYGVSGVRGVYYHGPDSRWRVIVRGKYIGGSKDFFEAICIKKRIENEARRSGCFDVRTGIVVGK